MSYTPQQIDFIREFSLDNKPVEWHHVFANLKEKGHFHIFALKDGGYELWNSPDNDIVYKIKIDPCLSPMDQPLLIEELLKLKQ